MTDDQTPTVIEAFRLLRDLAGPAGHASVTWTGDDGAIHASRTGQDRVPTYDELIQLHHAVWGERGYSYQVQAPVDRHVNIHPHALHLWGRADGARVLPDFGKWGSI